MSSHYRMRNEDEYEDYDEYEEYASGEEQEEEEEEEEEPPSQEQQEFLKLREELKEKFRQKLKKETAGHLGHRSLLQEKKRTAPKDNFGSFFGPSRPVIASRVLEERRSIRETQHITSRNTNPSSGNAKGAYSSSDKKTSVHKQQPKVVNEVKKKVQTLKGMRDYSFLLSDDTDLPDTTEEQQPPRKPPLQTSDGRQAQAPASRKPQMAKPARAVPNGHVLKNPATKSLQPQSKVGPVKSSSSIRPKPAAAEPKKIANGGSGSGRPVERKPLPSKVPAQSLGTSRPPPGTIRPPAKVTSAVHHSSAQRNHYPEQRRPSQSLNNGKPTASKPLPSSKSQPPKKVPPPQDSHDDRLKKKPMKRRLDESDDEDAIGMIRKMFGYNPNKYAAVDDDVSDMEADFSEIQKEERRSAKIARKEDEEQLRLIEEEERRERMRKKQKLRR